MKLTSTLVCAGLLLGLCSTASAGVIKRLDPCGGDQLPELRRTLPGGKDTSCAPPTKESCAPTPALGLRVDPSCLPKKITRCPPVIVPVLDTARRLTRVPRLDCTPTTKVDRYTPVKQVECYVPKTPRCDTPTDLVETLSRPSLRECKPTYGGGATGPVICAPKGGGGGYTGGGNPTPEPASLALAAMGAAGALARMRRRRA